MCGLAGFIGENNLDMNQVATRMCEAIAYRGPDAHGVYLDQEAGLALGHRRLSIVDLTSTGAQPMHSASGRFVISFNGEIYNHLSIRKQLDCNFRGSSDTETLLEAFSAWGIEATLAKCAGMFAFALWDKEKKCLTLARDRVGEKPLYYGVGRNNMFLFASELKALWKHPDWIGNINEDSLVKYFRYAYVPSPDSIFQNFYKLMPGTFLRRSADGKLETKNYWKLDDSPLQIHDQKEAITETEAALRTVIGEQMIADVSVGAFLSGGIDSSLVAAIMQEESARPIRTFTIAFQEKSYNEAPVAAAVARHLKSEHQELLVTATDALAIVPRLGNIYDEPFADSSQIPTTLLAMLTKKYVSVSLSGDGGDELFAGYNRYLYGPKIWSKLQKLPLSVRICLGELMQKIPASMLSPLLPLFFQASLPLDKYYKLAKLLPAKSKDEVYLLLTSLLDPKQFLNNEEQNPTKLGAKFDFVRAMQSEDIRHYLPDDILVKLDRACMSASLEGRAPLLDYRLLEVARAIPSAIHLYDGRGKWILRQLLAKRLPMELFDRPKSGFTAPIGEWLRKELREWAEHLLFQVEAPIAWKTTEIQKIWKEHQDRKRDWQHQLWIFLQLQVWWQNYRSQISTR